LLPKDEPAELKFNGVPVFEYAYPVLPSSVITHYIVRMNRKIENHFVWRTGVVLKIGENKALVKADTEDRKITIDISNEEKVEQVARDASRGLHDLERNHGCVPGDPLTGFVRKPVNVGVHRDNNERIAHRWEPNHDYILRIQSAIVMRAEGKISVRFKKPQNYLARSIPTKRFFTNKIYIGILEFGELVIPDYCVPIKP
jgi:hypothetical protein